VSVHDLMTSQIRSDVESVSVIVMPGTLSVVKRTISDNDGSGAIYEAMELWSYAEVCYLYKQFPVTSFGSVPGCLSSSKPQCFKSLTSASQSCIGVHLGRYDLRICPFYCPKMSSSDLLLSLHTMLVLWLNPVLYWR